MKRLAYAASALSIAALAFVAGGRWGAAETFSNAAAVVQADTPTRSSEEAVQQAMAFMTTAGNPAGRWTEGETFVPHVAPAAHFAATQLFFPGFEELEADEMRVTFMGSTYAPSQDQSGMSILVELGNEDNLVFDLGIGSIRNYNSMRVPFSAIDKIFISHLHMDHLSDLAYLTMFRPIQGGFTPLHIYGPSGSEPQYGTQHFVDHMMEMTAWHQDSFHGWPIGEGYDTVVHEFDFMTEGEVIYEQDGAKVTHWPTSHTKDGATSYRLDWNGRSLCYTGDNRPNSLTIKYCQGVDMLISEGQTATVSISSAALGMPPAMAAYTIDTSHSPGYGVGYICQQAQPKACVVSHYDYEPIFNNEFVAQVRHHWKGALAFGAPDLMVFNVHGDGKVWWREAVSAGTNQVSRPRFAGNLITYPAPRHQVHDVMNETVLSNEIDPKLWYPEGRMPELVREWPITEDLIIPNPFGGQ